MTPLSRPALGSLRVADRSPDHGHDPGLGLTAVHLKITTTEDEARITQLHTRNRPGSIALRRDSGRVITAFLAPKQA
jgi:hypothetical protein